MRCAEPLQGKAASSFFSVTYFRLEIKYKRKFVAMTHKHHTREHFIEILAIIDAYEDYCRSHPDYKNNRCICAVANIKRVYNERLQKHDFS